MGLWVAVGAQAQVISDSKQSVGGGGRYTQVPFYIPTSSEPTGMPHGMAWLKEAEIISINKDLAGKPYLLLDQGGQTYRIRGFPDGTYKAGEKIKNLYLVRGKEDETLNGRLPYLWFSTNVVTRDQILRHEMSALGALYPIN